MALMKSNQETSNSVIGEGSYFLGSFTINGVLTIDGKYEGKSLQVEKLIIGSNGKVKTNIMANSVIVEGTVIGNITARNRVMLLPTAKIYGDIQTPELVLQNGLLFDGHCIISSEKAPVKDLVEAEYRSDNLSEENLFPTNERLKRRGS